MSQTKISIAINERIYLALFTRDAADISCDGAENVPPLHSVTEADPVVPWSSDPLPLEIEWLSWWENIVNRRIDSINDGSPSSSYWTIQEDLETCVSEAIQTGNGKEKISELLDALRFNTSLTDLRHQGELLADLNGEVDCPTYSGKPAGERSEVLS